MEGLSEILAGRGALLKWPGETLRMYVCITRYVFNFHQFIRTCTLFCDMYQFFGIPLPGFQGRQRWRR